MLHQDARRNVGGCVVELLDERGEDVAGRVVLRTRHDEVVATDELSVANEEHLHPRLALGRGQGYDIQILRAEVEHLLALVDLLDGPELVAEHGRPLELQAFGGLLHAAAYRFDDAVGLTLQEQHHLIDDLGVLVPVYRADARSYAAVDVEVEARARVVARDGLGAGAVGEQLLQQVERAPHAARAGERPEVARAVVGHLARDVHLRKFLGNVDFDERVALVVFEARIVLGLPLLDEVALQDQRLLLGLRDYELEVLHPAHHVADLGHEVGGAPEVRADAVAQASRLADVQHAAVAVVEQVHAGR